MGSFDSKSHSNDFPDHGDISSLNDLKEIGDEVKTMLMNDLYLQQFYAPRRILPHQNQFEVDKSKRKIPWNKTQASIVIPQASIQGMDLQRLYFTALQSFSLQNNDACGLEEWVFFKNINTGGIDSVMVGKVIEILLIPGTTAELEQRPNNVLLSIYSTASISETYGMPVLEETGLKALVEYKVRRL